MNTYIITDGNTAAETKLFLKNKFCWTNNRNDAKIFTKEEAEKVAKLYKNECFIKEVEIESNSFRKFTVIDWKNN